MPRATVLRCQRRSLGYQFYRSESPQIRITQPISATSEALAGLRIASDALAEFSRRNHIRRLAVFGSVLRDDFRPDRDLDLLVPDILWTTIKDDLPQLLKAVNSLLHQME